MPSSHAQFVAFWSVSLALFLLVRHRPLARIGANGNTSASSKHRGNNPGNRDGKVATQNRAWSLLERAGVSLLAALVAAATAWSRIYLNYHTTRQVVVGSAAGVVIALGWFITTAVVRQTGLLAWGLELPIVRALRVRDLIVSEDMCQAGWEKWERREKEKMG
jgi:dolichyldiphosphatase